MRSRTASPGRYTNTGRAAYVPVTMQRQVPAVLRVRHPLDSVRRQSVGHSCYASETGVRSAIVQVAGSFHSCLADVQFLLCSLRLVTGPRSSASWSVWTGHDFRHHGRYGPEGFRSTELVPVFSSCWFDSGYMFAFVYVALVFQRHAWIDSGYTFAPIYFFRLQRNAWSSVVHAMRQSPGAFGLTAQKTVDILQLPFIAGRRFPVVVLRPIP